MDYLSKIQNPVWKMIYRIIITVQRFIGLGTCILVPLIVVYQVILRYVLKAPLMGIEEMLIFPIIWMYMIGGSVASEQRNHIECGILTLYIKKVRSMQIFKCFKSLFSLGVAIWLCYWSHWYFSYSLRIWKLSDLLRWPMFFAESAIFIGFVLMAFFTLLELIDHVLELLHGTKGESV
jgi:TRAP-type C4-dicarboxylate transport system permease small subunit